MRGFMYRSVICEGVRPLCRIMALGAALMLGACTAQTRVYAPAPPRVYVAPPVVAATAVAPGVEISVTAQEAPPPLPDYEQPLIPEDGYLWMPGYWHYGFAGYYWVPGAWVLPPRVGLLWTPGYWAFSGGVYGFHAGYWGAHVGFYGGVNYGFGYGGVGFVGGRWNGGQFAYNTAVNNVSTTIIHNTYNQTVINNITVNRVSYNGGTGGVTAAPTVQEKAALREPHVAPTTAQAAHVQEASKNPSLSARTNGGHPAVAAATRLGMFSGPGVIRARGAAMPVAAREQAMREQSVRGPDAASAVQRSPNTEAAAVSPAPTRSVSQGPPNVVPGRAPAAGVAAAQPPAAQSKRIEQTPKAKPKAKPKARPKYPPESEKKPQSTVQ